MELEEYKSAYQNEEQPKSINALKVMGRAGRHPVLKRMRLQLILESFIWVVVLSIYYSGFDGDQKPWYMNVLLVSCIALVLTHNILGLYLVRSPINGPDISRSLRRYAKRIRRYATVSIVSRMIAIVAILSFFAASVEWTVTKAFAYVLFTIVLVFIQVILLWKMWKRRISSIRGQIDALETDNGK